MVPMDSILITLPALPFIRDMARREEFDGWLASRFRGVCHGAGTSVPAWFIVTKCDHHLPGFSEFTVALHSQAERGSGPGLGRWPEGASAPGAGIFLHEARGTCGPHCGVAERK